MLLQNLDISREHRRRANRVFVDCLALVKGGKKAAFLWMKENLYQGTCGLIFNDLDFSGNRLQTTIISFKDVIAQLLSFSCVPKSIVSILRRVKLTSVIYLDFLKDACILIAMFHLLNETGDLFKVGFPSTVAWVFFASLTVPLFFSALETASSQPFVVLGQAGWERYTKEPPGKRRLWGIRIAVFAFYFFVPTILTNNREEARERREMLMRQSWKNFEKREGIQESVLKKLRSTNMYIEASTKTLLIFKSHELSTEKIIQLILQATMVLLSPSYTRFPTNSGFQALFDQPPPEERTFRVDTFFLKAETTITLDLEISLTFFVFSIFLSFLTIANSCVLIKREEKKSFLPLPAKLVLIFRSLLVFSTRLLCIVVYFGVHLGLLDSLAHWHADQTARAAPFFNCLTQNGDLGGKVEKLTTHL